MYVSERTVSLGTVSLGPKGLRQKPLTLLTVSVLGDTAETIGASQLRQNRPFGCTGGKRSQRTVFVL